MFESGAIVLYALNKYGKADPQALALATQWVVFANGDFAYTLFRKDVPADTKAAMLGTVDRVLAGTPYLTGQSFSMADAVMGAYVAYIPMFAPDIQLRKYPNLWAWMQRLMARPKCPASYREAIARVAEAAK